MKDIPAFLILDGMKYRLAIEKFEAGENKLGQWRVGYYRQDLDEAGNVVAMHNADLCTDDNPESEMVNGDDLAEVLQRTITIIEKYDLEAENDLDQ